MKPKEQGITSNDQSRENEQGRGGKDERAELIREKIHFVACIQGDKGLYQRIEVAPPAGISIRFMSSGF